MTNRIASIIAVVMAGTALLVAVRTETDNSRHSSPAVTADAAGLSAQLESLQRGHQALQETQTALAGRLAELERARAAAPADVSQLRQRMEQLEAVRTPATQSAGEIDKYGVIKSIERELLTSYAALMDTTQPVGARLKQIEQVKRYGYFDQKAQQAVADMYQQTENLNERGGVLAALKGSVPPAWRDQILADLNADATAGGQATRFRYFAIEALEPMLPDPAVQQWLDHLAQTDPEPKLAARAGQALGVSPANGQPPPNPRK